ncbi:MAG: hypothetical protein K2M11_09650, partial [Paramuribaculum sp.]|nr:hypothetical protein [Paramuribaculum sp.]
MRLPLLGMIVLLLINLGTDIYLYYQLKKRFASPLPSRIQLISAVCLYVLLGVIVCLPRRSGSEDILLTVMWTLFGYMTVYIAKYIFVIFDLIASI